MIKKQLQSQAQSILENLKLRIAHVLWNDNKFSYNNEHFIIPWIQEEAEYAIKNLHLPKNEEKYYLIKLEQILGEYLEEA
jgi:hypothetical protein